MSWARYLIHDFWTAREFNRRDEERRRTNRASRMRARARTRDIDDNRARIGELEQDLAEATLLLRTLADLCVQKGVLTADEVAAKAEELDALDGTIDGRIGEEPPDPPSGRPSS